MNEEIFSQKNDGDSVESILNELDRSRKFREWAGWLPGKVMNWLENGSLIPLLIMVSVYNIAIVLTQHYPIFIAAAVAILVDVAIFQNIMAVTRRTGKVLFDLITWLVFFVSLVFSVYLHLQFYYPPKIFSMLIDAIIYSSLIPFSIFGIAWRLYVQKRTGEKHENQGENTAPDFAKNDRDFAKTDDDSAKKNNEKKRGEGKGRIAKVRDGKCLICGAERKKFSPTDWARHFRTDNKHKEWAPN